MIPECFIHDITIEYIYSPCIATVKLLHGYH